MLVTTKSNDCVMTSTNQIASLLTEHLSPTNLSFEQQPKYDVQIHNQPQQQQYPGKAGAWWHGACSRQYLPKAARRSISL
mmetsp:Transcript_19777/g.46008  ORF Transcript_19777/g.46008 Transcript_19777/m.46008 type:complete len:80 (+) Transcript_19777:831-1070(+)